MKVADKTIQQRFKEILEVIYSDGLTKGNIQLEEFLEEIKEKMLSVIRIED